MRVVCTFIFFFKQKTADEMRISDWSSDVCSSDLPLHPVKQAWRVQQDLRRPFGQAREARPVDDRRDPSQGASDGSQPAQKGAVPRRIGRTKGGLNSKLHRSEEHTSELQSLMRISYAVFCLKKKKHNNNHTYKHHTLKTHT